MDAALNGNPISNAVDSVYDGIGNAVDSVFDGLTNTFNEVADKIGPYIMKAVKWATVLAAGALLTEPLSFAISHFNPGWMAAMTGFAAHLNPLLDQYGITDAGFAVAEFLGNGVSSMAQATGGTLGAVAGGGSVLLPPAMP